MIATEAIGVGLAAGGALLALWTLGRYPSFGPQTIRSSALACAVGVGLLQAIGPAMHWAIETANPPVALLVVALPVFVFAFWSGGVLMRALVSGLGGTGRPARAVARRRRRG